MPVLRATKADLELALQAIADIHGRPIANDTVVAEFLSQPACYLLISCEAGRVLGSLTGYALRHPHRGQPQFMLYEIDVHPEWRNRGIGKTLVERFVAEARTAGAFEVWVVTHQSNRAAMALYESCGLRRQNDDDAMWSLML